MAENPEVLNLNVPGTPPMPDTAHTPVTEPMINVEVQDRLLRELKRRLFPSDVEGILYSAIVGDLYWQDQLWSLMVDTWPRLQTNLGKLKQAVSSMEYAIHPFTEGDEEPTSSAQEKADFVEDALFEMHGDVARQEHDFEQTLEDIIDSLIAGFTVMEVYWEHRDGGIVPQCTRWLPARYYRYPYVLDDVDRLMLNPSGMLGGTQLVDFPPYKFLVCIKQSHANHPVFTSPMRCLTAWWIASRFGLEWMMSYAQLFGIPQRIAYYKPGDDVVYQKLVQMMRASATATWGVYPVNTKVEVLGTAGGVGTHMPQERLVDEADKVCDIMILGQTLTTEVRESGGNRALGMVHHKIMDEILDAASRYVAKVISTQLIPGIIQYNFGSTDELPTLAPVVKSPIDLFNLAQSYNILFNQMEIPVLNSELYERIEFTKPDKGDDIYVPPSTPLEAMPKQSPFGVQPEPEGTKPQPEHAPNGNRPAALKPNIVERVGASNDDPDDDVDPDDAPVLAAARKVSFALDYGEEPEPGEVMRFLEKVEAREHGVTTLIEPKALDRSPAEAAMSNDTAQYFRENAATIKGVKWKSIIDDRTTPECIALNGKRWTYPDLKPIGHDLEFPDFPPIKYNCRSSVMPVLKTWPQIQQWLKGIFKR
jgi:SPP1 gp7 family putative phage head morphogenesis protein